VPFDTCDCLIETGLTVYHEVLNIKESGYNKMSK